MWPAPRMAESWCDVRVRDLASHGLVWALREETLREVALRPEGEEVGALTVAAGRGLMAIFTERGEVGALTVAAGRGLMAIFTERGENEHGCGLAAGGGATNERR